jgi:hypothetical protein
LRLKYRALRLEFFTFVAAKAAWTSTGFSQGAPLRRRLERFRPALSSSRRLMPAKGEQMVGRGEGVHIDADLGDHGLGDVVADAGKIVQPLGGAAKGSERSLQPRVELRDRGFDLFDRLEMLTDQEAMMVAQASFQRGGEFLAREREPGMAEFGQPPRVALARHDRLQHAPAVSRPGCRK